MNGKEGSLVVIGKPFEKLPPQQQELIKENINNVDYSKQNTVYAATVECWETEHTDDKDATVETDLFVVPQPESEEADLKGTINIDQKIKLEDDNWYYRSFVFVYKSDGFYQVYTPAMKSSLSLTRGKGGGVIFKPNGGDLWEFPVSSKDVHLCQCKNTATGKYLHWDIKKDQFVLRESSTQYLRFEEPPSKTKSIAHSLKPVCDHEVQEFIRDSIKVRIGAYKEYCTIFVARVSLKMECDHEWRLSAQRDSGKTPCFKAFLKPSSELVPRSSWKPWHFVLAEKEQASFEVLTAIAVNHGLIMQLENKNPHFANPDHSSGWTLCEFVYAGEDTWYWKVKGMDHYLYCDASTGDLTVTSDVQFRSSFTLIQDARFGP
jgi:hypothetical protein